MPLHIAHRASCITPPCLCLLRCALRLLLARGGELPEVAATRLSFVARGQAGKKRLQELLGVRERRFELPVCIGHFSILLLELRDLGPLLL